MKMNKCVILLTSLVCFGSLSAQNATQIGRYASVDNKPSQAQVNPLLSVVRIHFSNEIKTVGDALTHWLSYSGYKLVAINKMPAELRGILEQDLPQSARTLGPLTIKDGLLVLVGQQVFELICDPLHRLVSFKLNKKYRIALKNAKGGLA